jgi:hypothetical protein
MLCLVITSATVTGQAGTVAAYSHSSYCIAESTNASVRLTAEEELRERWSLLRSEMFGLEGDVKVDEVRLADPFLDITLRGPALDNYRDSDESDPRTFGSVVLYCFPVFVPNVSDPCGAIVIVRNQDESGKKFSLEAGEFMPWGVFGPGGRTAEAVQMRDRYKSEVSFVSFHDTAIPGRIMLADSDGLRSGTSVDSLRAIADDARRIKRYLKHQRDY